MKKEEAARKKAEKEAAARLKKEEATRIAAEKKEAAARLKKEEAARKKAEKEAAARLKKEEAARKKAEKEAAARLKKEEAARIAEEKKSMQEEEKRQKLVLAAIRKKEEEEGKRVRNLREFIGSMNEDSTVYIQDNTMTEDGKSLYNYLNSLEECPDTIDSRFENKAEDFRNALYAYKTPLKKRKLDIENIQRVLNELADAGKGPWDVQRRRVKVEGNHKAMYIAKKRGENTYVCGTGADNMKNHVKNGIEFDECCTNLTEKQKQEEDEKKADDLITDGWKRTTLSGSSKPLNQKGQKWYAPVMIKGVENFIYVRSPTKTQKEKGISLLGYSYWTPPESMYCDEGCPVLFSVDEVLDWIQKTTDEREAADQLKERGWERSGTRHWFSPQCDSKCSTRVEALCDDECEMDKDRGCCAIKRDDNGSCPDQCMDDGVSCSQVIKEEDKISSASRAILEYDKRIKRDAVLDSIFLERKAYCFRSAEHDKDKLLRDDAGVIRQGETRANERLRKYMEKNVTLKKAKWCEVLKRGSHNYPYESEEELCRAIQRKGSVEFPVYVQREDGVVKLTKNDSAKYNEEGGWCKPYNSLQELREDNRERVQGRAFYREKGGERKEYTFNSNIMSGGDTITPPSTTLMQEYEPLTPTLMHEYEPLTPTPYMDDVNPDDVYNDQPTPASRSNSPAPTECKQFDIEMPSFDPHPYQRVLQTLISPTTALDRMMVVWRTGAGKTAGALSILNNFYHDPRPKIVVVPDDIIVERWMTDLLQYDNPYRTFVIYKLLNGDASDRRIGHRIYNRMGIDTIQMKRAKEILANAGMGSISVYQKEWEKARNAISEECPGIAHPGNHETDFLHILGKNGSKYGKNDGTLNTNGRKFYKRCEDLKQNEVSKVWKDKKLGDGAEAFTKLQRHFKAFWPEDKMRGPLRIMSIAQAGGAVITPDTSSNKKKRGVQARVPFKYRTQGKKDENGIYVPSYKEYDNLEEDEDGTIKGIYDDTIVLIDEFHNLLTQYLPAKSRQYCPQYTTLKEKLRASKNNVVVGMTATPIVGDRNDADRLLEVLRTFRKINRGDKVRYLWNDKEFVGKATADSTDSFVKIQSSKIENKKNWDATWKISSSEEGHKSVRRSKS